MARRLAANRRFEFQTRSQLFIGVYKNRLPSPRCDGRRRHIQMPGSIGSVCASRSEPLRRAQDFSWEVETMNWENPNLFVRGSAKNTFQNSRRSDDSRTTSKRAATCPASYDEASVPGQKLMRCRCTKLSRCFASL